MSPRGVATIPPLEQRRRPGLSVTLTFPRRLDTCQSCGTIANELTDPLLKWNECDEYDKPTAVIVVLCGDCSKRLIDPHPRLYRPIDKWQPWPGGMDLCVGCKHLEALACKSPLLKANGGPGLALHPGASISAHLNYGGGRGEFKKYYKGPPTACDGREELA